VEERVEEAKTVEKEVEHKMEGKRKESVVEERVEEEETVAKKVEHLQDGGQEEGERGGGAG
jgi:hypothetical protein